MDARFDIAIAGGGLAGGMIALALARARPELSVAVIERAPRFGANHIWSFFASDVAPDALPLVEPLIARQWDAGYDVAFPGLSRRLSTPYRSTTSEKLDAALRASLPPEALFPGTAVAALDPAGVLLADGRRIAASGVIDARGAQGLPALTGGWQKFVGQMLRLERPHGVERPMVMDATVPQVDGYRFVYCLPFSEREIFVEDTYYSDAPMLDRALLDRRIRGYAQRRGWRVAEVLRSEAGVLPVVTGGDFDAFWASGADRGEAAVGRAGVRAGLFQPLTSFSLPDAVRFAQAIACEPHLSSAALARFSREYAERHWRAGWFYRALAKMLFAAAEPDLRYRVLRRFYGLDAGLIERFYAGESTRKDALRIVAGRPPVPIGRAIASLAGWGERPRPLELPLELNA